MLRKYKKIEKHRNYLIQEEQLNNCYSEYYQFENDKYL